MHRNGANIATDDVRVISTCPYGYTLSVNGPADSTLYKDGDKTSTSKINTSLGTKNVPVSILGENIDTWGFVTGSNITSESSFIGLTSNLTELTTTSSASAMSGDVIPVYYGVSVDTNIEPGLYTMAESSVGAADDVITYFLTTSLDCTSYQVAFNPTSTATGSAAVPPTNGTNTSVSISAMSASSLKKANGAWICPMAQPPAARCPAPLTSSPTPSHTRSN